MVQFTLGRVALRSKSLSAWLTRQTVVASSNCARTPPDASRPVMCAMFGWFSERHVRFLY